MMPIAGTLIIAAALAVGTASARAAPATAAPATATPTATPAATAPAADWHKIVQDFAREHFKNPAWGYSHSQRDYALARELAASGKVRLDDDVLFAAAYLHDMAAFPPWENQKLDHSDVAADIVGSVLKGTGFPEAKLEAVRGAIRTHMYYRDPKGPEALYLHDADALDWLGAIGAARIIALVDPNGGDPDGPKAIGMINENLAKVPARVLTPAGRALLPKREAELRRFVEELRKESDDLRTL